MYGTGILPALPFDLPLAEESATQLTVFSQTQIPAEIIGISNLTNHYTCTCSNAVACHNAVAKLAMGTDHALLINLQTIHF
jgi:hypothetical protein